MSSSIDRRAGRRDNRRRWLRARRRTIAAAHIPCRSRAVLASTWRDWELWAGPRPSRPGAGALTSPTAGCAAAAAAPRRPGHFSPLAEGVSARRERARAGAALPLMRHLWRARDQRRRRAALLPAGSAAAHGADRARRPRLRARQRSGPASAVRGRRRRRRRLRHGSGGWAEPGPLRAHALESPLGAIRRNGAIALARKPGKGGEPEGLIT